MERHVRPSRLVTGPGIVTPAPGDDVVTERAREVVDCTNQLLAAVGPDDFSVLKPHLELVELRRGQVLYEAGEGIRYVYFPNEAVISLVNTLEDGGTAEVAVFGRGSAMGLLSTVVTREAFGRYVVQIAGTASRIPVERLTEARNARPNLQQLIMGYTEVLLAHTFQLLTCNAVHPVEARCCRWLLICVYICNKTLCRSRMSSWPRCWASNARL